MDVNIYIRFKQSDQLFRMRSFYPVGTQPYDQFTFAESSLDAKQICSEANNRTIHTCCYPQCPRVSGLSRLTESTASGPCGGRRTAPALCKLKYLTWLTGPRECPSSTRRYKHEAIQQQTKQIQRVGYVSSSQILRQFHSSFLLAGSVFVVKMSPDENSLIFSVSMSIPADTAKPAKRRHVLNLDTPANTGGNYDDSGDQAKMSRQRTPLPSCFLINCADA